MNYDGKMTKSSHIQCSALSVKAGLMVRRNVVDDPLGWLPVITNRRGSLRADEHEATRSW